jgi:hypothetical protein
VAGSFRDQASRIGSAGIEAFRIPGPENFWSHTVDDTRRLKLIGANKVSEREKAPISIEDRKTLKALLTKLGPQKLAAALTDVILDLQLELPGLASVADPLNFRDAAPLFSEVALELKNRETSYREGPPDRVGDLRVGWVTFNHEHPTMAGQVKHIPPRFRSWSSAFAVLSDGRVFVPSSLVREFWPDHAARKRQYESLEYMGHVFMAFEILFDPFHMTDSPETLMDLRHRLIEASGIVIDS